MFSRSHRVKNQFTFNLLRAESPIARAGAQEAMEADPSADRDGTPAEAADTTEASYAVEDPVSSVA